MNAATVSIDRCPYPGCALEIDHDGDHIPRYRLAQRFEGFGYMACDIPGCKPDQPGRFAAMALYQTHDGRALALCAKHETTLAKFGPAELLKGGAA